MHKFELQSPKLLACPHWRTSDSSQDTPRFVCMYSVDSQGLPFISQLWFSGKANLEKTQSRNMEALQDRGPGQCLFTSQTPWVRDVNITISSRQSLIIKLVMWGEGRVAT